MPFSAAAAIGTSILEHHMQNIFHNLTFFVFFCLGFVLDTHSFGKLFVS
jgi:hypothetical protein